MIGHPRPASSTLALARAAIVLCACLAGNTSAQTPPPAEPVQLRITWGGGEASRWIGRVAVDDGSLSNLKLLGTNPDAAGSIWLEGGHLRVATLAAHKLDSIELTAQSAPTAKLLIELAADNKAPIAVASSASSPRFEIPLADLPKHPYHVRLDDRGNTLQIQIIPQPALRITTKRDPLIFAPGEQCAFEMSPAIANLTPGTQLVVDTTLSAGRRKDAIWSDNQRIEIPVDGLPKVALDVPLPRTEGVYTIHVVASRPSGFARVWSASTRLAERSFQVVVLEAHPPAPTAPPRWESVLEIDPTNPRWIERLPSWTQLQRIPGLSRGALGSIRASAVQSPMGRFIELPTTAPGADPHWQAYSLPLEAVGVPHMLEIDYQAEADHFLGISIVEPNANGVLKGIHRDAGVYVEGLGRSEAKQKQTHRLVFWPRTQAPLLVISNLHPIAPGHFGQIRVFKRSASQLTSPATKADPHNRLIAAYLARPTVAETFGATQVVDPATAAAGAAADCVDDCQTAYESATRLADYLRYSGYNSAIVSLMADGRLPTSAAKPLDVDNTELMLRVFDRQGLTLVPAIDFAAPLPKLETLRRGSDPRTSGLEPVGPDGRSWLEANGARRGLAPYYNLLDPRVQQAMLENVHDLLVRYDSHPAMAGLAIQLSSDGYAQLPPLGWGLDDVTIDRFERDTGIKLTSTGPDRFATRQALLTGEHAAAWRSWRSAQVTAFYTRLAKLVRGNGNRRIVLTTENMFANPQLSAALRPNLLAGRAENRLAAALVDIGLDRQALESVPGIVFCPTRYVEPMAPLPDRAIDLELNEAFALRHQSRVPSQTRGALLYHRSSRQRLKSFEVARTPWRIDGEMQLVCQPLPHGGSVREPYLQALAEHDPSVIIDGGELLPIGQEDTLREARFILAQLPTDAQISDVTRQPLVVRTYTEADRVTIVAMNLSPWHCDAQVSLDVAESATLEPLTAPATDEPAATKPLVLTAGRQSWPVSLAPYEMRAVRTATPGTKVVDVQTDAGENANAELAGALTILNNRDLTAPRVYQALANPSFEPFAAAGRLPGWRLAGASTRAISELDATSPQDGKSCLYLRCDGQSAVVESELFQVPPTGQLAMTIFARGQKLAPTTELCLVFEAEHDGQTYRQSARVSAAEMQRPNNEWGVPFVVFLDNLPLESRAQMKIAFELTGPGEVWLDNAKLYDLLFPLKFYPNAQAEIVQLSQRIHAAKSAFDAHQISDCTQMLDGYWPRFILAHRPPIQPKIAAGGAPPARDLPPQPNEAQEPAPSIGKRIKGFVPILR